MEKRIKIAYWITTGLLTFLMLMSAGMYFLNHEEVAKTFEALGFPTYVIYPLAIAKLLGLVAIWTRKSKTLIEWAYAGYLFNFLLAASAHINIGDGEAVPAMVAVVLLFGSYFTGRKLYAA